MSSPGKSLTVLTAADVRAEVARLKLLAEQSTDATIRAAYQRALRAFFQQAPGRPAKYKDLDRSLLDDVANRLAAGNWKSERDVILDVVWSRSHDEKDLKRHYRRIVRHRRKQGLKPPQKKRVT
ncbi:hypothetical protein QY049_03595 [Bradyrhizobium sp. WYCCWR 13022]|uniref:hypothetical protein n=1 Tax=unclassified Bradyrhizobium TaxID=2631580 RepID=UPI00263B2056|nr:hypothetical protein [Bradyrhizobium sp. WYCCWR 13022]MDN4982307.1 hypothetical protein [Bradyrhizobium sp. WYCCWR 13022]